MPKLTLDATIDARTGKIRSRYSIPMSDATATQAEEIAARFMSTLNYQLEFSKSNVRLVPVDAVTGKPLKVKYSNDNIGWTDVDNQKRE